MTKEQTPARRLYQRLSRVEKIGLRSATPGMLDHMANNQYAAELFFYGADKLALTEELTKVYDLVNQETKIRVEFGGGFPNPTLLIDV